MGLVINVLVVVCVFGVLYEGRMVNDKEKEAGA